LATVHDILAGGDTRLLTLTGPGGSGKTRLALAAARQLDDMFNQGVYFVPLAAATDAAVAWQTLVGVVGAAGDGAPADLVAAQIADRPVLVVLDNLEQLAGAGELVHDLLTAAPRAVVIATSRRVLHLPGEYELPVPPLDLPPARASFAEIRTSGAVALFAMHAAMVKPGFTVTEDNEADVVAICERLDGLPLAIELAAARTKLLSPQSLRGRLDRSLGLSGGTAGRPDRHQTLRQTIGWSYDLLDDDLRRAFRALSVFVRGCDLDGLAAVALASGGLAGADPLDVLASLVDLNLSTVREGPDGEPRAGMLVTIREFAAERLAEADEAEAVRRRHAEYYLDFAEQAAEQLSGSERLRWLDRLEAEHDNLRAALSWALSPDLSPDVSPDRTGTDDDRASIGLRLVGPLTWFWYGHGHAAEGRRWLERAVDQNTEGTGRDYVRAVHGLGVLLIQQGEHEAAQRLLERALRLWRALDDPEQVARVLSSLGVVHRMVGELDVARPLLEESIAIARRIGAEERLTTGLSNLAVVEVDSGRNDHAIALLEECLEIDERNGDPSDVLIDKTNLVGGLAFGGRPEAALALLRSILDGIAALGDVELTATAVELAAVIAAALGAATSAARLAGAAESIRDKAEMPAPPPDIALLDRALGPVREVLGDAAWDRERDLGRTFDQAEALALAAVPEPAAVAEHIGQQAVTGARPSVAGG
jgi:predicted ATPase